MMAHFVSVHPLPSSSFSTSLIYDVFTCMHNGSERHRPREWEISSRVHRVTRCWGDKARVECAVQVLYFNADQLCCSGDTIFFRRFRNDNELHNVPYVATYHRDTSDTWLDLYLVEKQDNVVDFWKSELPFINGHYLLTVTLNLHTLKPTQPSFSYRDYKAICATTLTEQLKGLDWFVTESAPLEDVSVHQTHIKSAIERLAPIKTILPCKNATHSLILNITMIRERGCLYRCFRRADYHWTC